MRQVFNLPGCPIRTSTDHSSFATPRSFSQLTTSFVVSESLGIPRAPLFASKSLVPGHNSGTISYLPSKVVSPLNALLDYLTLNSHFVNELLQSLPNFAVYIALSPLLKVDLAVDTTGVEPVHTYAFISTSFLSKIFTVIINPTIVYR